MAGLTAKQETFVKEYLVDLNATQAAIRAGYSEKTANEQASRLLANVKIKLAVQSAMDARSERTEITADRVLTELAKIGFSDVRGLFSENGSLLPINELSDEAAACLSSIEITTRKVRGGEDGELEEVAKVRLWDKRAALVDLGRHLKLFTDKVEHSGDSDFIAALAKAQGQVKSGLKA